METYDYQADAHRHTHTLSTSCGQVPSSFLCSINKIYITNSEREKSVYMLIVQTYYNTVEFCLSQSLLGQDFLINFDRQVAALDR